MWLTFSSGAEVVCPGFRWTRNGRRVKCDRTVGTVPAGTVTILKMHHRQTDAPVPGCFCHKCRNCGALLDIKPMLKTETR